MTWSEVARSMTTSNFTRPSMPPPTTTSSSSPRSTAWVRVCPLQPPAKRDEDEEVWSARRDEDEHVHYHHRFHTSNPRPRATGQTSPMMTPCRPPSSSLKSNWAAKPPELAAIEIDRSCGTEPRSFDAVLSVVDLAKPDLLQLRRHGGFAHASKRERPNYLNISGK
jgi:hypothetical protein